MAIVINGSGTVTGITAGGLPDGSITDDDLATGISAGKLTGTLPAIDGSALTGISAGETATAWVNFDGNSTSIRDSYNISSVSENGTADYTVNFSSNLANTNYMFCGVGGNNFVDDRILCAEQPVSTAYIDFMIRNLGATQYRPAYVGVVVFGGQ